MTNSDDLLNAMPYMGDKKPATSHDIAHEITVLTGLLAGVAVASRGSSVVMAEAVEGKSEMAKTITVQKIRVSAAIESFVNHRDHQNIEMLTPAMKTIDDQFEAIRAAIAALCDGFDEIEQRITKLEQGAEKGSE